MTDSDPKRPDVMGAPDVPFDTMAGGLEPEGTSPDVMAVPKKRSDVMERGRKPAVENFDLMRASR